MTRVEITKARLKSEEGKRARAYNDKTGKTVTCQPNGNLSIGYGINLETGLDDVEMDFLLDHRLGLVDAAIARFSWMQGIDDPRGSVFLDVGFNDGVTSLLHFPKCIAAAGAKDWTTASAELLNSDAARELPSRYKTLAQILLTGDL
jgi:hypothetical protein